MKESISPFFKSDEDLDLEASILHSIGGRGTKFANGYYNFSNEIHVGYRYIDGKWYLKHSDEHWSWQNPRTFEELVQFLQKGEHDGIRS